MKEEGFGLAILEAKDFAVSTDEEFALLADDELVSRAEDQPLRIAYLAGVNLLAGEGIFVGPHDAGVVR